MGSTGVGKTDLAIAIFDELSIDIISVDSVQIYKYLNIGSGKLSTELLRKYPHKLVDKLELEENYSAGLFRKDAIKEIELSIPLVVRLAGTNVELGKKILNKSGLKIISANNLSDAAKKMLKEKQDDWFDISTLKEPFRVEGKKTLGYEIAEQMGWKFPDVIIYETGGGTGLIGMWKAFIELKALGWVSGKLPRMVAAQSDGCAPVVKAFQNLQNKTDFWENSNTIALGLNVPGPLGGAWILDVLYQSNGIAISIAENQLSDLTAEFNSLTNLNASAEAGVVWGAYNTLLDMNWINHNEEVVLFATGVERCKFK